MTETEKYLEKARAVCGCYDCRGGESMPCHADAIAASMKEVAEEAVKMANWRADTNFENYECEKAQRTELQFKLSAYESVTHEDPEVKRVLIWSDEEPNAAPHTRSYGMKVLARHYRAALVKIKELEKA